SALYTSLMARAAETAEIIAGAVGHHEAVSDCDFCEHHPGEADGISWAEADRLYPPAADWEPDGRRVPGAETWREMSLRVARGLDTVAQRHRGGTVVIVCHGGVIVHSLIRWLGLEPNARAGGRGRLDPVNTSITEWCLLGDRNSCGAQDVRLERFNDHAHLSGSRDGTGERRAPVPDRRP
ncbi:MAG: histidine phosphatase family protein, partial [Acidimicrobiales bacterium]